MSLQNPYIPSGKHLIAGHWIESNNCFKSSPAHGPVHTFSSGTPKLVNSACCAAEDAFEIFGNTSRKTRAAFLRAIAEEINVRAKQITEIACQETGLPATRLESERGRTTGQLNKFADHILEGDYLDRRHDIALPDREPLPRPDLRLIQRPVGPVAVFGASNFPLAFSVAGGDTASALAAGCPVVVKGHSAHPGTSEVVAEAIHMAISQLDLDPGVFSLIQGGSRDVGAALVQHPLICAVGFTGSLSGGRALFNLCAQRENPIPFFGELGSINPLFLLPQAVEMRGASIAQGWADSLALGAGQFCTNPGIVFLMDGADADAFVEAVARFLAQKSPQTMLTDGIADTFRSSRDQMLTQVGVTSVLSPDCEDRSVSPQLLETTGEIWLRNEMLSEEVFGPLGIVVRVESESQFTELAKSLKGQLTCTLHLEAGDSALSQRLLPILERKAGRVIANGFPTGVEVADAMVHSGPYPASTNFGATSVGTLAIRRFLRPVCYQDVPENILPPDILGD